MDMKQVILSLTFLLTATLAHAQLTLDECQRQAQVNYPLVRRYGLIEKAREYDLSNAGKGISAPVLFVGQGYVSK